MKNTNNVVKLENFRTREGQKNAEYYAKRDERVQTPNEIQAIKERMAIEAEAKKNLTGLEYERFKKLRARNEIKKGEEYAFGP